jgi:hypothetical protein
MLSIRYSLFLVLLLLAVSAVGQSKLNLRLKRELDSIEVVDQQYRLLLMGGPTMRPRLDSVARVAGVPVEKVGDYLGQRMTATDSVNIKRIVQIIKQYGYPGKTLVGTPTNEVALLVIQHSSRIPQYLPLIKRMADQGEVSFATYARMLDRHLMQQGKMQIYGTQGRSYNVPNAATGKMEQVAFIWPIEDATHVNERRKKAGFDSTVEANAQRLGIEYKPMTMAEVQRIEQAVRGQHH